MCLDNEFSHDFPKSVWADSVESLGQVNKGRVEVAVLFHTFFLKLTGSKYHVGGSSACAEAALTFREETLLQVVQQTVEGTGQDLACYGQEGDSSVVVAGLAIFFAPVHEDYCGVPEFLWQMLFVPHGLVQACQLIVDGCTTGLKHLSRNGIGTRSFSTGICLIALLTSLLEGGMSSSWLVASCGRCAIALSLIAAGRFSMLSKCSAQLSRICFLSVGRVEPSALSITSSHPLS